MTGNERVQQMTGKGSVLVADHAVPLLKGQDQTRALAVEVADALGGGKACRGSGDIGNLGLDGCLAQVAVIVAGPLAHGGIDDHLDLAVGDEVQNIRAALIIFIDALGGNSGLGDGLAGHFSREDLEAGFMEPAGDLRRIGAVLLADSDQDRTLPY